MCEDKVDGRQSDGGVGEHDVPETAVEVGRVGRLTKLLQQAVGSAGNSKIKVSLYLALAQNPVFQAAL